MNQFKVFFQDGLKRFQSMPALTRVLVLGAGVAGFLALVFWGWLGQGGEYGVLFANLPQEDAAAITAKLKSKKVPYLLEAGGGTILVPRGEVYEQRLALAGEGMPRGGGVGFELFDRQSLGATEFVQRLNYQRALQGELGRTICGMPEVAEARIHLVTPKESLFVDDQKKAGASVALKLRPGRVLNQSQIDGIVHLVASAVPELHPSQVTVVDLNGRILSRPQDSLGAGGLSTAQMTFQRQAEESLERKVQSLLDQVVGVGKSMVRVAVEVDFQKVDVREEIFTPNREMLRSEQKTTERSLKGTEAQGNPESRFDFQRGSITPPPPGKGPPPLTPPAPPAPSGGNLQERSQELRNYEINRIMRQVVDQPGKLKRLSVAAVVDGHYQGKGQTFAPRSPEELRQLANLAKKAVGFSTERGDQMELTCAPLAAKLPEGAVAVQSGASWASGLGDYLKVALLGLVLLGGLLLLLKRRPALSRPPLLEGPAPPGPPYLPTGEPALPVEASPARVIQALPPRVDLPDAVAGRDKVTQLITTYPDRTVEVLRLWMHEQQNR